MLIKVCGNDVYGIVGDCIVWVNMVEFEVLFDEEE